MEPPLESRAGPLGLIQPLPPVGRCSQAGRGGPQARPANPSAPLILNRQPSRENPTPFGMRQNPFQRLPDEPVCGYAMFPLPVAGSALGRRNSRARTLRSPSASVTRIAFVAPSRHRRGRRFPSASGFGHFPPCVGERKTLTNP